VGHPDPTFGLSLGGDAPGAAQPEEANSVYASTFRINTYKSVSEQTTLTVIVDLTKKNSVFPFFFNLCG
jgi:hypothetical protein